MQEVRAAELTFTRGHRILGILTSYLKSALLSMIRVSPWSRVSRLAYQGKTPFPSSVFMLHKLIVSIINSFGEHPEKAFDHIRPLMDFAAQNIPESRHASTPLFILATAGMRLIDHEQQNQILTNVRTGIASNFNFHFPEGNLEIISGKQEGIYQWLAINYVLDKFEQPANDHISEGNFERPKTVGAIDMGGASMQIAMEVTPDLSLDRFSVSAKFKLLEFLQHKK